MPNMSSIIDKVTEDTLALYGHLAIFSDGIERLKYYQAFAVRTLSFCSFSARRIAPSQMAMPKTDLHVNGSSPKK
jgi:hypothetical protein